MAKETQAAPTPPPAPQKKKFSLRRKEIPFDVEKLDGQIVTYLLKEMDGTARDEYLNLNAQRITQGKDGQATPVINDYTGLYASLLAKCVYDERNVLVNEADIQTWPGSVQADVHQMAMELNGLDANAKAAAKNA